MSVEVDFEEGFDFEMHKQKAINSYISVRSLYEAYGNVLKDVIEKCLAEDDIKYHSIESRAKSIESFGEKACKPSDENLDKPKYPDPLINITDLTGVRIITFFPKTLDDVNMILYKELEVIEKSDKSDLLDQEERLGYKSVHYLIRLKQSRCVLPEYKKFGAFVAEIQVRTILQHAWAEIEHDIEYKSAITIPSSIKRRFMALAGLLEIADREFQSIQYDDETNRVLANESVEQGLLDEVEITPDALKAYLDKKLGSDGRMTDYSYSYDARMLIKMGFSNFKQIDDCIKNYNDDKISRILYGTRQGQINRFEYLLLTGMGETYIRKHPWGIEGLEWFIESCTNKLKKLKKAGIQIGNFDIL